MSANAANPRRKAADAAALDEESVEGRVVEEVRRHGPSGPADLLANVGAPPYAVIEAVTRLFAAGVLRFTPGGDRLTLRARS